MSGAALSGDGRPQAGMGVDAGDYNGDGLPDLVVTNFSHDYNTLYENGPAGVFTDRSYATGVASTAGPYLGWGVKFVDLDNDGRLDIFIANGHVYPEVDKHGLGTRYQQRKQVFLNEGTRFRHASAEVGGGLLAREVQPRRCVRRLRQRRRHRRARDQHERSSDTASQRHGAQAITGSRSGSSGARATAMASARGFASTPASDGRRPTVRGDGSYMSHSDTRAHFGLGEATRVDRLEIRWPSGARRNGHRTGGRPLLCRARRHRRDVAALGQCDRSSIVGATN